MTGLMGMGMVSAQDNSGWKQRRYKLRRYGWFTVRLYFWSRYCGDRYKSVVHGNYVMTDSTRLADTWYFLCVQYNSVAGKM